MMNNKKAAVTLLCLCCVALSSSSNTQASTSSSPRWFQRAPQVPEQKKKEETQRPSFWKKKQSSNTTTTRPLQQTLAPTKPRWLQRATNTTTTKQETKDIAPQPKKQQNAPPPPTTKQAETNQTKTEQQRHTLFGRKQKSNDEKDKEKEPSLNKSDANNDKKEEPKPAEHPKQASSPPPSTNNQTTVPQQQQQQPQQQQQLPQQQGLIFVTPAQGHAPRGGRPGTLLPQQPQRNVVPNPNQALVAELLSVVASTVARMWLLTWVTKHLSSLEEKIVPSQHFVWERLNDKFSKDDLALQKVMELPPTGVAMRSWRRNLRRLYGRVTRPRGRRTLADYFTRTVVVVELSTDGDAKHANKIHLEQLSDVVSFLIAQQRRHKFGTSKESRPLELEVVFLVSSPGGAVSTFGLAAAQMQRLRNEPFISTTVCVDQYAASGGYMIASQADQLVAAPFATIGSVGVILEGLNFHDLAKRYGVTPMVIKAGQSKNPLTMWGPVTSKDVSNEKGRLEKVHQAFQDVVREGRPGLDKSKYVVDGSVYLGHEALRLGMIDKVQTADEYVMERIESGDRVLKLHRSQQIRYPRSMKLTPVDILPHLRTWLSKHLVQAASWVGFAHHLLRTYVPNDS